MEVPSRCVDCNRSLGSTKAISFSCECCIALCIICVIRKISSSDDTYDCVITCPKCSSQQSTSLQQKHPQIKPESISKARIVEDDIVNDAFAFSGIKDYRARKNLDKVRSLRAPRIFMIGSNYNHYNEEKYLRQRCA